MPDSESFLQRLQQTILQLRSQDLSVCYGRVQSVVGSRIEASLPNARLGDAVSIAIRGREHAMRAEVVGLRDKRVLLSPYDAIHGIAVGDPVHAHLRGFRIPFGDSLLGRVVDALGEPLDQSKSLSGQATRWLSLNHVPPPAITRPPINTPWCSGVRAIDTFCTLGEGQRVGLFASAGVGKSVLLAQLARDAAADVCVLCLIGERGRELREFLDDVLGPEGLKRTVVVCATSDTPSLVRAKSLATATRIAEGFRDEGKRVLLLVDSLTRYARALREISLANGEMPARRGYPASVFTSLPVVLERAGTAARGCITAIYTVLVEGDSVDDPIAEEVRSLLDGHIVLQRELAERGRWPAIDPLQSISRLFLKVSDSEHQHMATTLKALLQAYESKRDLIALGAHVPGHDALLDQALQHIDAIEAFLSQSPQESSAWSDTCALLRKLISQINA